MTRLSAAARARLKPGSFAIRSKAKTAKARKEHGNYPINDSNHARLALAMVAKHGTPSEKERVRRAVLKKFPGIAQKKSSGGDVTGLISELYGMVSGIGEAAYKDYGATDKYGEIKDPAKYITGDISSSMIDPLAWSLREMEEGNTWEGLLNLILPFGGASILTSSDDIKESQKLANVNKIKETRDNAAPINYANLMARDMQKSRTESMLADGGLVKGKSGVDQNQANVEENSFVIPKEKVKGKVYQALKRFGLIDTTLNKKADGDVPVFLTAGEVVVPPNKVHGLDLYLQKKGIGTLKSLAPNAKPGNRFDVGGEVLARIEELKKKKNLTLEENEELTGLLNELEQSQRRDEPINKMTTKSSSSVQIPGTERVPEKVTAADNILKTTQDKEEKDKFGWAKTATGLAQSIFGTALASSMGEPPITSKELENAINKPFLMTGTQEAIRLAKKNAETGLDPIQYSSLKKEVNDMYITAVTDAKMGAGSAADTYNRMTMANLGRIDQKLKLAGMDAELKQKKEAVIPGMMQEADQFAFRVSQEEKQDKFRLAIAKQQEYDKEADAYSGLMSAGIANLFDTSDMARFWNNYQKVSNPYTA